MTDGLLDIIQSLTRLMREETALLLDAGPRRDLEALAGAKLRLTASLEAQLAARERAQPDARGDEQADTLADAIREMQDVSAENARVLKRQIELSREMLDAIAAEAKRLAGSRTQTYGATGGVFRIDGSTPISVNTSL